jgi:hypothetical protein
MFAVPTPFVAVRATHVCPDELGFVDNAATRSNLGRFLHEVVEKESGIPVNADPMCDGLFQDTTKEGTPNTALTWFIFSRPCESWEWEFVQVVQLHRTVQEDAVIEVEVEDKPSDDSFGRWCEIFAQAAWVVAALKFCVFGHGSSGTCKVASRFLHGLKAMHVPLEELKSPEDHVAYLGRVFRSMCHLASLQTCLRWYWEHGLLVLEDWLVGQACLTLLIDLL